MTGERRIDHSFIESVERLAKVILGVGGASYILGLFVVNAYLYDLGVADFTLVRPRFIITGILTLVVVAASIAGAIPLLQRLISRAAYKSAGIEADSAQKSKVPLVVDLSALLLPCLLLFIVLIGFNGTSESLIWILVNSFLPVLLAQAACLSILLGLVLPTPKSVAQSWSTIAHAQTLVPATPTERVLLSRHTRMASALLLMAASALITVSYFILTFATLLLPSLPPAIGGVMPEKVQIVLNSDVSASKANALLLSYGVNLDEEVELLWESESGYLVRSPDGGPKSVSVDKRLVAFVIHPDGAESDPALGSGQPQATPVGK